jgi:hypothetical protein
LNVSSVSSSSVWGEEYLEKLRKQQQEASDTTQTAATSTEDSVSKITPEEILTELQTLEDDPEKLKAKAAELAAQVTSDAEKASGVFAEALNELASDLEAVAEDGNLSVLEKKIADAAGTKLGGPSRMSGSTGASIKWIEALVEVEVEEDDEEFSFSEALAARSAEAFGHGTDAEAAENQGASKSKVSAAAASVQTEAAVSTAADGTSSDRDIIDKANSGAELSSSELSTLKQIDAALYARVMKAQKAKAESRSQSGENSSKAAQITEERPDELEAGKAAAEADGSAENAKIGVAKNQLLNFYSNQKNQLLSYYSSQYSLFSLTA